MLDFCIEPPHDPLAVAHHTFADFAVNEADYDVYPYGHLLTFASAFFSAKQ